MSTQYKGYSIEVSKSIGFYSTGRAGKTKTRVWVESNLTPGIGKWCSSVAEAKKWVNEELKKGIVGL